MRVTPANVARAGEERVKGDATSTIGGGRVDGLDLGGVLHARRAPHYPARDEADPRAVLDLAEDGAEGARADVGEPFLQDLDARPPRGVEDEVPRDARAELKDARPVDRDEDAAQVPRRRRRAQEDSAGKPGRRS